MEDPIDPLQPLIVAALARIAEGSLGEAGAQLWSSLKTLFRRRGEGSDLAAAVRADPPAIDEVGELAELLTRRTENDAALRSDLEAWLTEAQAVIAAGNVSNRVSGEVHGKVVQARDIGSLHIE